MKNTRSMTFVLTLFLAASGLTLPGIASETELATEVTLLIGRPKFDGSRDQEVLVVPGAVIQVRPDSEAVSTSPEGEEVAHRALREAHQRIGQVAKDLVKSLRLSVVELRYRMPLSLAIAERRDLPPPTSTSNVRVSIELLGFNADLASYQVRFFDGVLPLTNTPLTVQRGKQAVVGGLDGKDAPYLFLLIAPAASEATGSGVAAGPVPVSGEIRPPIAIDKTPARYTPRAKQEGVEGVVLMKTTIDEHGTVSEVKVLEGLPHGLSEAAVEAIKQWRFEPASNEGRPIAVTYHLTLEFRLPPDDEGGQ